MERLWTADEVAEYLRVPLNTLYDWRTRNYGPRGKRVGKYLRFNPTEVVEWFEKLDAA